MEPSRHWIFWNRLVGGGDGYLVLACAAAPFALWQQGGPESVGGSMFLFVALTLLCAATILARMHYLARIVYRGTQVVGQVLGATRTGRFRVRWELAGHRHEAELSRGVVPLKQAREVTQVLLLVDPQRTKRALITHIMR